MERRNDRAPAIVFVILILAALAVAAIRLLGDAPTGGLFIGRAEAAEEKKPERLKHVDLPKGYRLVNVATQCFSGGFCEPWWLLQSSKDPTFFLYTNGEKEYAFTENK